MAKLYLGVRFLGDIKFGGGWPGADSFLYRGQNFLLGKVFIKLDLPSTLPTFLPSYLPPYLPSTLPTNLPISLLSHIPPALLFVSNIKDRKKLGGDSKKLFA
jgi:hypothetical protein